MLNDGRMQFVHHLKSDDGDTMLNLMFPMRYTRLKADENVIASALRFWQSTSQNTRLAIFYAYAQNRNLKLN